LAIHVAALGQPARQGRDTRIALRERKRDDGFIVGDAVAQYTQVAQVPRDHTALYAFGLKDGSQALPEVV
jgi:hypothetical protein